MTSEIDRANKTRWRWRFLLFKLPPGANGWRKTRESYTVAKHLLVNGLFSTSIMLECWGDVHLANLKETFAFWPIHNIHSACKGDKDRRGQMTYLIFFRILESVSLFCPVGTDFKALNLQQDRFNHFYPSTLSKHFTWAFPPAPLM